MGTEPVKSAHRTLEILELLAQRPAGQRSLGELSRELNIPKSSLHGILRTMSGRGWVQPDRTGTRFGLGLRALQVGAAYLDGDDTVGLLRDVLDGLAERFGETVHLGRLDGAHVVYLAKRESVHPLRMYSAVGRRLPAHATALGKALLADRADAEVDRLLPAPLPRLTPNTLTAEALREELGRIRGRGHAIDREENSAGIRCVAVAVPLQTPAVDAISISIPVARWQRDTEPTVAHALRRAVAEIAPARALV
jgi:DNA-binding IclR family transcriptional regulator